MKKNKYLLLAALCIGVASIGLVSGAFNQYAVTRWSNSIMADDARTGTLSYGDSTVTSNITLPSSTVPRYQDQIIVYNPLTVTIAAGSVLISSNVAANTGVYVTTAPATINQKNVIGIAAESIAAASNGFMVSYGGKYVLAKTTGTIVRGDVLCTTGTIAGTLGVWDGSTVGANIAVALRPSTDGNTILVLMK